tara:strand:+ start:680 stop:1021 length:342 start_codon:yes stop_codon:yes gene_type:complete
MNINKETIHRYALWAQEMNSVRLTERIELSHFMLLTEILRRDVFNEAPINVMWLQKELAMSFTKVKAVIGRLEARKFIKKIPSKTDKRYKQLSITHSGKLFAYKIISNHNMEP